MELYPLHVSLYNILDLSLRVKEVLRDGKHDFSFLIVKINCARVFAETLQLTVKMDCLDFAF